MGPFSELDHLVARLAAVMVPTVGVAAPSILSRGEPVLCARAIVTRACRAPGDDSGLRLVSSIINV